MWWSSGSSLASTRFTNTSIKLSSVRMNTGLCLFQKQLQITEEHAANCSRDKWSRKMNTKLLMFMSCYSNCIFYEMSWRQQLMFLPGPAPLVVKCKWFQCRMNNIFVFAFPGKTKNLPNEPHHVATFGVFSIVMSPVGSNTFSGTTLFPSQA